VSLLEASDLRKTFGANVVLDGLDLSVEQGECVVLIDRVGRRLIRFSIITTLHTTSLSERSSMPQPICK